MHDATIDQIRFLIGKGHVRSALELLNTLSPCRFTAIYRFDADQLQNLVLYDREQPDAPLMDTIPVEESYCTFVQRSRDAFLVDNALLDSRVAGHPKRPVVQSYFGFPLVGPDDSLFGTLCQFDFDVVDMPADILALMQELARQLDPRHAMAVFAADLDRRIESLALMTDLIVSASPGRTAALDAFEIYAGPLRSQAGALPAAQLAGFIQRLDAMAGRISAATV